MSTQTLSVTGMTCQHCVAAVSEELRALDGVTGVAVELEPEGTSTVTVTAERPLTDEELTAALDEAGEYRLLDAP
ncbi:heavy-metal-associated domain-containing protein [uncultured Jatrophihabitans sp.]|uniref:heavy-metal-associated domain-containing protein n=1 Tax=uncultured Jatrophihabitans sp. TaxID=1610747 RepID=UPI0035C9A7B5